MRLMQGTYRPILALGLLMLLTVSTTGCQLSRRVSHVSASPSPVTSAGPTPFPTDATATAEQPDTPHDFGSLVVDAGNETIWLLAGDQAPRLLTHGQHPRLSPDGCLVAFNQPAADPPHLAELLVVDVNGSTANRLLSPGELGGLVYGLAWSPDSKSLAATTGGSIKMYYSGDLWLVDVSDGTVTQLAERGAGVPAFSPNGEWIATYTPEIGWSHGTIGLWHVEDRSGKILFGPLKLQYLEWADDSGGFTVGFLDHETESVLWWVPVDGAPTQLGRLESPYAMWHPGAERVAYYSTTITSKDEGQAFPSPDGLHLANLDGSGDEMVPGSAGMTFWKGWTLDLPGVSPWSPDGRWLLTADQLGNTFIVDTDRSEAPFPLNVDRVHGWLDETHYLASAGGTELRLCVPPATCHSLARLAGDIQGLSHTNENCGR